MFTNNLVMFSFRYLTKILVGDQLQQRCFGAFHGDSRARASKSYLALVGVKLGGSRLDRVDLKTEFVKKTSVHSLDYVFRSICKDQIVWYAQVHNTHTCFQFSCFGYWFSVFGLTDIGFHEQIVSKQVYLVLCVLDSFYIHACFISQTNLV